MDSDLDQNTNPSLFPFDRLSIDIQSRILGLLPITTLVVCRAVSPSWLSIIRSPDFLASYYPSRDPIFLLWTDDCPMLSASAYLPSTNRWIGFHFPQSVFPFRTLTSSGPSSLILSIYYGRCSIVSPFSAPHPFINFHPQIKYEDDVHYALAFIEYSPSDYSILFVGPCRATLFSYIYHSRSGKWEPCPNFAPGFFLLESGVYLDGLIFCLSSSPDHLLTFNPVGHEWTILHLDFPLPSLRFRHLLTYGGELYLTAALQDNTLGIIKVGIWELDRSAMAWREFGFMPAEYLAEFYANINRFGLPYLDVVDCMGMICFFMGMFSFSIGDPKKIVMCDLAVRRWWRPKPCNIPRDSRFSIRLAIEPRIDLLK